MLLPLIWAWLPPSAAAGDVELPVLSTAGEGSPRAGRPPEQRWVLVASPPSRPPPPARLCPGAASQHCPPMLPACTQQNVLLQCKYSFRLGGQKLQLQEQFSQATQGTVTSDETSPCPSRAESTCPGPNSLPSCRVLPPVRSHRGRLKGLRCTAQVHNHSCALLWICKETPHIWGSEAGERKTKANSKGKSVSNPHHCYQHHFRSIPLSLPHGKIHAWCLQP